MVKALICTQNWLKSSCISSEVESSSIDEMELHEQIISGNKLFVLVFGFHFSSKYFLTCFLFIGICFVELSVASTSEMDIVD